MAFLRLLVALTLSLSLALACKTFDSVRVEGDWPLDDFNTTIEQFGIMRQASDCVYQVTISNLAPNMNYNWRVVIEDWNVTIGCNGKNSAPCVVFVGASGTTLLKFDPSSLSLSSEYVSPQRATRGTCSKSYTVVSGDYCYLIATNNQLTTDQLVAYNPGLNCNNLQIGVVVCLLPPTSTVVEIGYTGMDIQGGDITSVTGVTSSLACALLCDANANCKAWVWSFPGSGCPTNTNTCWLKGANVGTRITATCRELGFKLGQAGVDRSGGDLPGMPLVLGTGPTTAAACGNACKSTSGCVAWSFDSCGGRNCWLKSSVTGTSANSCRVSGVQGNVNVDLAGADLPGAPAVLPATATATDCSMLCASTAGCNSWAFVTPGPGCETVNNCWMKSAAPAVNSGTAQSCRASLSQPGLSAPTTAPTAAPTAAPTTRPPTAAPTAAPTTRPPTAAPGPTCGGGNICHYNKCPGTVVLIQTPNGQPSVQLASLPPGASFTTTVPSGWAGNYKNGWTGLSLAEFQINGWGNIDYYDISYIVGFDFGMQIKAPNSGKTLTCPANACADAYHLPDDVQTHTCPTGGQFVITWCV